MAVARVVSKSVQSLYSITMAAGPQSAHAHIWELNLPTLPSPKSQRTCCGDGSESVGSYGTRHRLEPFHLV